MSNKVTVHTGSAEKMSGTSRNDKQWVKYRQKAYVHIEGKPYPLEFNIDTWPDRETGVVEPPLAAGEYLLLPKVVGVTRYGELIYRNDMKPVNRDLDIDPKPDAVPPVPGSKEQEKRGMFGRG